MTASAAANYAAAVATRKAISAEVWRRYPMPGDGASDEEVEAWLDGQAEVEAELGLSAAEREENAAATALITWLATEVKSHANAEEAASIALVVERATRDYATRERVLALAMAYGG